MMGDRSPSWVIREDASTPVMVALYVRQALGIRTPESLPAMRRAPLFNADRDAAAQDALERQWRGFWEMTVEPRAHTSAVPLDLVDGFDDLVALPVEGYDELRTAMLPLGSEAVSYARDAHRRYAGESSSRPGVSYRAYASAIAEHERAAGRRAHSFELNVEVLPLAQRGLWWIGALTVAVTDGLRGDVVAFDSAIGPVIAELA